MTEAKKKMVFVSHASADAKKAGEICTALENLGLDCWIAPRDIDPGKQYGEEIIHGIECTQGLVLVLSKKSNESPHVRDEAERAKHYGKRVIPFRIEDIMPSKGLEFYIATSQWIDAFGPNWEDGINLLANTIAKMAGEPPPAKTTPSASGSAKKPKNAMIAAACVTVLAVGIGGWAMMNRGGGGDAPPDQGSSTTSQPRPNDTVHNVDPTNGRGVVLPSGPDTHPDAEGLVPDYHALVIGINDYKNFGLDGWDPLRTARRDAEDVADILNKQYGFTVECLLDKQATRANIMAALDDIATQNPDDAILVYYAGHGFYNEEVDQGYWIPSDARRKTEDGRSAKEDWVWNSTITEILNSTKAKHVLLVADSCFSGSLFRGAAEENLLDGKNQWYRRAIKKDSRYLITSGDLEPVMDGGGGGHSVFAQQLLNFLENSDENIFSASDLAQSVRQRVSNLTGQLVRMGHMPVSSHAGGEFVFLRRDNALPEKVEPKVSGGPERGDAPVVDVAEIEKQVPKRTKGDNLKLAMEMFNQGATNTSLQYVSSFGDDRIANAVIAHLTQKTKQASRDRVHKLIEDLEARKAEANEKGNEWQEYARPRIVALMGPTVAEGIDVDETTQQLIKICLTTELAFSGKIQVVERDALEDVLEEMNIGTSELADDRASLTIGKLLPASMLLMGNILPSTKGSGIYMRMVDTETTGIKGSFKGFADAENDITDVCREIGEKVTQTAVRLKPLTARILSKEGDVLRAGAGSFHGATFDTEFVIHKRSYPDASKPTDFREEKVGTAVVIDMGEETCDLEPTFTVEGEPPDSASLWIKEKRM